MRLLVLGGTAFLGREVARSALAAGHDVTCVARGSSGPVPPGATLVRHDRDDPRGGLGGTERADWDAVVDVARDPGQVRRAMAALGGRAGHWAFVSTLNVYADHAAPGADESTPLLAPLEVGGDDPDAYGAKKVACEEHVLAGTPHPLVARAGLIGGPGDLSGRTGYWPWRMAHPVGDEVLVPDAPDAPTQVLDVRDLADWLVRAAEHGTGGVVDAVGPTVPLGEHLSVAREAAGSAVSFAAAPAEWLTEHGVQAWAGPRSLPLWLPFASHAGFAARSGAAARALGLTHRPLVETLRDTLAWEEQRPSGRSRQAGLTDDEERDLLAALRRGTA